MVSTTDPAQVAELLYQCVKRMRRLLDDGLGEHGLSLPRARVLAHLDSQGATYQAPLAEALEVAPRTITEFLDTLERDGLVERRVDPADRRARQVHITPAGSDALKYAQEVRAGVIEQVFGSFSERQLSSLSSTLRRLLERVDTASETRQD